MIQSIVNTDQRGELGMHYTSVPNILKVLDPLFLDDLREQVNTNWSNKKGLHGILRRLSKIRVFDPACGSGNFLVIAYRELRAIEIKVINRLSEIDGYAPPLWSHVELTNFYGIEYADFAAETAKLSLWIAEYQMNSRYEDAFGKRTPALPLKETGNIVCGNALRVAWQSVCPHSDDPEVETYIVGNPPYLGTKNQKREHKEDIELIFRNICDNYKSLDYVSGWFLLGKNYVALSKGQAQVALVSTNSVCQSTHVVNLWPLLFEDGIEIGFAYRPFHWKNNASQNAGVTVIIVSLRTPKKNLQRYIFDGDTKKSAPFINPYLMAGRIPSISKERTPISDLPNCLLGSLFADGNNFIIENDEELTQIQCDTAKMSPSPIHPYIGGAEYIRGISRHCLYFNEDQLSDASAIPSINARLTGVSAFRAASTKTATQDRAKTPHRYTENRITDFSLKERLIAPITFSGNREYYHVGPVPGNVMIPATAYFIEDKTRISMAILSSRVFFCWMTTVGNTLRADYRFSNTLCWNTFPVPELSDEDKAALTKTAEGILLARDTYFDKTIAELYDPDHMQKDFHELWEAHQRNDEVLETIYNGRPFKNDTERLEHLFARYSAMVGKK